MFLKYLRGYVKIKVSGYSPERFMNLCSNHNILLWDIENHCDYYIMCISISGFFSLKPFLKKTKTKVAVLERYGLPFFLPFMKKRFIFFFGLLACIAALIVMSKFVWAIEFQGNETLTNDVLMDYLKSQNVTYGMAIDKIPIEELEKNLREDYDILTWVSLRVTGTKLEVLLKENSNYNIDKMQQGGMINEAPTDIVATKAGTIVSIITRNGTPQVVPGSEVEVGDILVSGLVPIIGDDLLPKSYQYYTSDADIYIKTTYDYKDELDMVYNKTVYTGREKKYHFFEALEKEFTLLPIYHKYLQCEKIIDKEQVKILDNLYLPLFHGTITIREMYLQETLYEQEEAWT